MGGRITAFEKIFGINVSPLHEKKFVYELLRANSFSHSVKSTESVKPIFAE